MYSMIVVVYEPRAGISYGGYVAGPVFKNVAEKIYAMKTNQVTTLNDDAFAGGDLPGSSRGYARDFENIFEYLNIKWDDDAKTDWSVAHPTGKQMTMADLKIRKSMVPDVKGMGARDAVFLLEKMGLNVRVEGVGKVKNQSIAPGARANGQNIIIHLN
jgi:cell division protein FtsI (penicillin-binding protein 3)